MLTICTWFWGDKYGASDVAKLAAGIRRGVGERHRFVVVTDERNGSKVGANVDAVWPIPAQDHHLLPIKGCFARLRMFDPTWQAMHGLSQGHRLVCIDLDSVVTGNLDPLFYRAEPFMILKGANAANPCPVNGSVMMLRFGHRPEVWTDFSLDAAAKIPFYEFPDDQGWIAHKLPQAAGWQCGPQSGIYAFKKPAWPKGDDLPGDARLVVFPGKRDPSQFTHLPWVKEYWREAA